MSDNYFIEEGSAPDETALKSALGERYSWYEGVLGAAEGFELEWKYHGRKYGWKLKVHDGDKALFELTVTASGFRLGVAARESELEDLREDADLDPGLAGRISADKVKEGWGVRFEIDGEEACKEACLLIKSIASLRHGE